MTRPEIPWTILIHMTGEPDLAEAMVLSLKEMYRVGVGAESRCRLVVQFTRTGAAPRRFTQPTPTSQDGLLGRLGSSTPTRHDTAIDEDALENFIATGIRSNPSQHYLVILSGHASGVVGRRVDEPGFAPGLPRTLDLGPMFERITRRTGRVIDVLGMDACFMSMCEICWELRSNVRYLVASEGLTPQYGWPYHRVLEIFRGDPTPTPEEVARELLSKYLRYRADFDLAGQSVDLSASEIGASDRLATAVKSLAGLMSDRLPDRAFRDALVLAHWKAQSYKAEQYVDLWDFANLLLEQSADEPILRACRAVRCALSPSEGGIVRKTVYNGPDYQHSHGLSIYYPWTEVSPHYGSFGFARATGWHRFLTHYVTATRRGLRDDSRSRRAG